MKINWTKVSKLITKDCAIWGRCGDFYYISDSIFMIKTPHELKGSTLTKLISIFGKFPEDNQDFMICRKG